MTTKPLIWWLVLAGAGLVLLLLLPDTRLPLWIQYAWPSLAGAGWAWMRRQTTLRRKKEESYEGI